MISGNGNNFFESGFLCEATVPVGRVRYTSKIDMYKQRYTSIHTSYYTFLFICYCAVKTSHSYCCVNWGVLILLSIVKCKARYTCKCKGLH